MSSPVTAPKILPASWFLFQSTLFQDPGVIATEGAGTGKGYGRLPPVSYMEVKSLKHIKDQ